MDHAEARGLLEVAAAEPDGLERLMAGDTPEARALAGHLVECADCTDEVGRLRQARSVILGAVRSTPSPELRERTLSYVAQVGRVRERTGAPIGATPAFASRTFGHRRGSVRGWAAGIAALLVVAVAGLVAAGLWAQAGRQDQARTVAALERLTTSSVRVAAAPDVRHVALEPAAVPASGTLLFSPSTRELVVVATGLPEPSDDREFRCWVEVDGEVHRVGRMFFAHDLAFWAGEVEVLGELPPGTTFGVTLVDPASESPEGAPAIVGEL